MWNEVDSLENVECRIEVHGDERVGGIGKGNLRDDEREDIVGLLSLRVVQEPPTH